MKRDYKNELDAFAGSISKEAISLSDYLADNPELSGQEFRSSELFADKLREYGFDVEYSFLGLPTAFFAA